VDKQRIGVNMTLAKLTLVMAVINVALNILAGNFPAAGGWIVASIGYIQLVYRDK
jgi:hypothetical protein